ncbi:MAG: hypothetical protein IH820_16980 [Bacteroidetes bacterium]|nr:hypothetical protein [Bacteroidota bacterium]
MKAIEKKPDRRYQQAEEMLAALEAFEASYVPIEQADTKTDEETASWPLSTSKRTWVLRAALMLVLLAGGIFFGPQLLNLISPSSPLEDNHISVEPPDDKNDRGSSGGGPDTSRNTLPSEPPDTGSSGGKPNQPKQESQLASVEITTTPPDAQADDHEEPSIDLPQLVTLTLDADIDAEITLDGRRVSRGAASSLGEGSHHVVFRSKTGAKKDTTIIVGPGQTSTIPLTCYFLQKISVSPRDDTGKRIRFKLFIDEKKIDEKQVVPYDLEAKFEPYRISAKKAGYTSAPLDTMLIVAPTFKKKETKIIEFILTKK